MKCAHCLVEVNPNFTEYYLGNDTSGFWSILFMKCPNQDCNRIIIDLACGDPKLNQFGHAEGLASIKWRQTVRPISSGRPPAPPEVDLVFAQDYSEACSIIKLSPKASAALSRRCLQNILREKAGIKNGNLVNEIQQVIDSKSLPAHLAESIDAIRHIGNFAAHPLKSTSSGEIIEVEIGEAEWSLDVLEALFDFYFVQPAILKAKRSALDAKLKDANKPPMK
ncbi:DUF4145 domain-containing protein [Aquirufa ecclesiirivi]|uniref:DUF4145 domain-containing protein n=1 Tax=Aquirufa ecclesiirivi TaxID=2715124 RepID=UPI0023D7E52A|nr:DUF4145 domain-containing protein [Aquirufa ecclesiirivi]MDF0692689.1 DUF4145 domain-containing protein [Aquirufa ecclesiirivi]